MTNGEKFKIMMRDKSMRKRIISKVNRNATCPCGSKVKFKRCCLVNPDLKPIDKPADPLVVIELKKRTLLERLTYTIKTFVKQFNIIHTKHNLIYSLFVAYGRTNSTLRR